MWILRLALALPLLVTASASAQDTPPPDGTPSDTQATDPGTSPAPGTSTAAPTPTPTPTPAPTAEAEPDTSTRHTTSSAPAGRGGARSTATVTRGSAGATGAGAAAAPAEEEEEEEGDGRDVDFLWIEIEGGISDVNLIAFSGGDIFGSPDTLFQEVRGTGPFVGAGLGFRVFVLAIGARFSYANYQSFDVGTIGGDATLRLPIPIVEPYLRVGFGYAWQGQANYANPAMSATTVYGWSFDSALGLDIYLTNWFTIGAGIGLNLLNMSRQSDPTMPCMGVTDICPGNPGDAVGYQLRGFGQIGFRF